MILHPLIREPGMNRFCGPAVVSFLTGMSTDDAARQFRAVTNKSCVMGTTIKQMRNVLRLNGIVMIEAQSYPDDMPTLVGWLRETRHQRGDRTYLVEAGRHWQLVSGRRFACGKVGAIVSLKAEGVPRRSRVRQTWIVDHAASVSYPARQAVAEPRHAPAARRGAE